LDQEVGTLGVDADPGEIGAIANAPKPCMKLSQIKVRPEKTWDDDYCGTIASWDAQSIVDRGRVEDKNFRPNQSFSPE
jgi:hypothetical protein